MLDSIGYRTGGALSVLILTYCASCVGAVGLSGLACPVWSAGNCACGDSIGGIVQCDNQTGNVSVHFGYCMTLMNDNDPSEGTIVGRCPLSTTDVSAKTYLLVASMDANNSMCSPSNKDGPLCGNCAKDTGLSITLTDYGQCRDCTQSPTWAKAAFLAIQLLPATVMFLFILFARIRASSPHLNIMIFFCQMIAYPNPLNTISYAADYDHCYTNVLYLLYNMWSMLLVLPSSLLPCFHPKVTFIPASLIHYGVCVYVFTLMAVIYACIFCYNRGYRLVVCLSRPLVRLLECVNSSWNVDGTLIDAFFSVVVLMYWRVTVITMAILQYTEVYNSSGSLVWYRHYFDASLKFFDVSCPLEMFTTLFAIVVLGILLFPPILLAFYQFRFVHFLLNKCSCRRARLFQLYTKTFADTLQHSFKDGTDGTRDYRFFASFYFLIRLIGAYVYISEPMWSSTVLAILFLILLLLVCWLQPHKRTVHNFLDGVVFGMFVVIFILHAGVYLQWNDNNDINSYDHETGILLRVFKIAITVILTVPLAYFTMSIVYWVVLKCRIIQRRLDNVNTCCRKNNNREIFAESVQVDRYQAALHQSVVAGGDDEDVHGPYANPSFRYGTVVL